MALKGLSDIGVVHGDLKPVSKIHNIGSVSALTLYPDHFISLSSTKDRPTFTILYSLYKILLLGS